MNAIQNVIGKNESLLAAFGIPCGADKGAARVRRVLARLLETQAVRLADLQTARDIAERAQIDDPAVYLFLAAMFVSANRGNAFMREANVARLLREGGRLLVGGTVQTDAAHDESVAALCPASGASAWRDRLACEFVVREDDRWYFQRDYAAVGELNATLKGLASAQKVDDVPSSAIDAASRFGERFSLNAAQVEALRAAASQRFTVVTGGPGTGKTTTVCAILRALFARHPDWTAQDVALVAPTGRAAQRMQEAILAQCAILPRDERVVALAADLEGSTVHRLLGGYAPRWRHDAKHKLEKKVVIVDETSMVDLYLMQALLKAVSDETRLVFLGDADQLPSVDTGAVLGDLTRLGMDSSVVKRLVTCERAKGEVSDVAAAINGLDDGAAAAKALADSWKARRISSVANLPAPAGESEFRWLEVRGDVQKAEVLGLYRDWLAGSRLADLAGGVARTDAAWTGERSAASDALFAELNRLRILTLVRDGWFGARQANDFLLREAKKKARRPYADYLSLVGVPIIVTRNTPERKLFNGDVGVTVRGERGMVVLFPRGAKTVACPAAVLPEHELAYAMTVHKSQGSEFENVMVVLPNDAEHPLLTRQIVYTGLTRAKKRAVLVGAEASLVVALAKRLERDTGIMLDDNSD